MIRIIGNMYMKNLPYAILLSVQLVIVSFVFNISFVMVESDRQALENINIPKGEFYFATAKNADNVDLKKLQNILGNENVGYIERDGGIAIEQEDSINSPAIVYLAGASEEISYALSDGNWFTGEEGEVILGGDNFGKEIGDTINIIKDGERKEGHVVGILKEPVKELNFESMGIDNFDNLLWGKERVIYTNDKELISGEGFGYKVEEKCCLLNLTNISKKTITEIKKEYRIVAVKKSLDCAKNKQGNRKEEETVRLTVFFVITLVIVAIQVFLYVRKNKKEFQIFRMLGMSWNGIYGMILCGHIGNVCIGILGMYILFQSKGILANFGFIPNADLMRSACCVTGIFFFVYILVTALIFIVSVIEEERREVTYYGN